MKKQASATKSCGFNPHTFQTFVSLISMINNSTTATIANTSINNSIVAFYTRGILFITFVYLVCVCNARRTRYHPSAWCARRWACCDAERRSAPGCQVAADWPLPEPQLELLVQQEKKPPNDVPRVYSLDV